MRGKARFLGEDIKIIGSREQPGDLHKSIRELFSSILAIEESQKLQEEEGMMAVFGEEYDPCDIIVDTILIEMNKIKIFVTGLHKMPTKIDFDAERNDIFKRASQLKRDLKTLKIDSLAADLRRISPTLRRKLESVDQLECANVLGELNEKVTESIVLLDQLKKVVKAIKYEGKPKSKRSWEHYAMKEAAIRLLRVAKDYGMQITATYNEGYSKTSPAVQLLCLLGPHMNLTDNGYTWRDIIIEVINNKLL